MLSFLQHFGKSRPAAQWAMLVAVSAIFTLVLYFARLPAVLLIGPMLGAIVAGTNGASVRLKPQAFTAAHAIVGCLIAGSISPSTFMTFLDDWPVFTGAVVATLLASSFLGWLISRFKILPGTTAVWGSAPGGSTAMVLMAEAFGADARLVAFMQYLRVILVSIAAAFIARQLTETAGVADPAIDWFPPVDWLAMVAVIAATVVGPWFGRLARIPSPAFLGTLVLGSFLHLGLGLPLVPHQWLLAIAYVTIGWTVGLNFTAPILRHAARALPQVVASIAALMALCGALAWLISHELGIDPLTAYLATSPGGLDSVMIIAAASDSVDISFVLAFQSARLIIVLAFGPWLARLVSRWVST